MFLGTVVDCVTCLSFVEGKKKKKKNAQPAARPGDVLSKDAFELEGPGQLG